MNFASDITERKQAEEVIRASLREKEVLLREIHHRVKNNMQIISSLFNLLISNALKHAFPAGRKGVLTIRLRRGKGGAVELRIADNGVGFPEGLDFRRTESLGLQIVSLLVGQLEGTIKLDGKNGTTLRPSPKGRPLIASTEAPLKLPWSAA